MNKFGIQYLNKYSGEFPKGNELFQKRIEQKAEILEVLRKFQAGYTSRDPEKAENFVEELFINGDDTCVLGTGTGELFLGSESVKTLIKDDWEYWGDVNLDWQNAHIDLRGDVAWFASEGSVKYSFEDSPQRYESYVNFIKNKAEEKGLTAKQKITFINWALTQAFHHRTGKRREYLWPLQLSGVLLKTPENWKIVHLQFSISKANFPDERFENSKEHLESYNKQNAVVEEYKNNRMNKELKAFLKGFEEEFFNQIHISKELVSKYFDSDGLPYVLGPENQLSVGVDELSEFFSSNNDSNLHLDLEHAIASGSGTTTWITATGLLKQYLTADKLAEAALEELDNLLQSGLTSKEKLFAAHRSVAYALKESASGEGFTCPFRLTAVINNAGAKPVFHSMHFSFPSYWVFEGKLDSI